MTTPPIAGLETIAQDQLTQQTAELAESLRQAPGAFMATTAASLLLVVGVYLFLLRLIDGQERDKQATKEAGPAVAREYKTAQGAA